MRIAVIGATRGIGLALVQAALNDGHEVTALVRSPSTMPVSHPHLKVVAGDALDPAAVAGVVEGQDVVCDCLGTTNVTQKITMFSRSAENLSKALKPEQLLIAVTGIGSGDSKGYGGFLYDRILMPIVLRRMYADKDRQERIIRDKIARWIIVRPGFLNNGPLTKRYRALTDLQGIHGGKISRADVADFLLSQAKSPTFIGKTPLLIY
ncbi:SDR family oxidoreductase [Pseudomonas aeruginosa]|uniref:NAD(P)-dependent oxidoreductase n=1 Tax=Pseudomonas aeruginosa TaxID=287 RepID=UPI0010679602|nr:SDR family oxidoreductase [Pseudomonas aeruginosa]TEO19047.1 SDR family oxidoreductase [Pseudomonas aeruginosa]TEO21265.1 SDR family oxidoreductase [Pseudomonas aeruginosa]TEO25773.1 SDR family oxidoreductase [Pseudomonas aeruginosa]TEO42461.1 SDR family oxidoreductase [Pseudomonas aeruginosa]